MLLKKKGRNGLLGLTIIGTFHHGGGVIEAEAGEKKLVARI